MSHAVAIIRDDTLEEPLVIIGVSTEQLARMVADYLRVARPVVPATGERMGVPVAIEGTWYDWLWMNLEEIEDITVHMYDTETRDLMTAGQFQHWMVQNGETIAKQHKPLIEDLIYLDERYRM